MRAFIEVKPLLPASPDKSVSPKEARHRRTWAEYGEYWRQGQRADRVQLVILLGCFVYSIGE